MKNPPCIWSFLFALTLVISDPAVFAGEVKNLASANEGGYLAFFSSQYNNGEWKAQNLIDGSADKGWAAQNKAAHSVIIGFKNNALAEIHDILINPYTKEDGSNWAKDIEIQVSTTYPFRDFRSVGKFTLKKEGSDQVFSFPQPTKARYVKVRFLSNYDGTYMEAGEIQVMGKLLPEAPPATAYSSVAVAAKGAKIEKFTSQYDETTWAAGNLLKDDGELQWAGKSKESQEVIIALPEVTDITDIAINNSSKESPDTWAKDVEVEVSSTFSYKGFTPAGKISMPQIGDLHTISLPAPMPAKYIKVLFRTNYGGSYMETARIRVYKTEATGKKALAQELEQTGRAVVYEIRFGSNSAEILPGSETILGQIAGTLQEHPKLELIIEGHTDNVGGSDVNLALSRNRAKAVRQWLVDKGGISEGRMTTVGQGASRPIADNSTEEGKAKNRRVELVRK